MSGIRRKIRVAFCGFKRSKAQWILNEDALNIRHIRVRSRAARGSAIGSRDAAVSGIAAPRGDLVLDRELQLLEPRDQYLVRPALLRLPSDFGFEAGMLAPEVVDMSAGHRLLHAK